MTPHLLVSLFGTPTVTLDDEPVTDFVSTKSQALLFYLAVSSQAHARSSLATLLWDDVPENKARASLRSVLKNLKCLVGSHLVIERHALAFRQSAPHKVDVTEFEQRLAGPHSSASDKQLSEAANLYKGDFLDGFHVHNAFAYESWLQSERNRLRELALDALCQLANRADAQSNLEEAINYARRALLMEPWREEFHRKLIGYYAKIGERSAALAQYEACRLALAEELAVEPSVETNALYDRIRDGVGIVPQQQTAKPAARSALTADDGPSLPTNNLPYLASPMIGRQHELANVLELLQQKHVRLVTLTGPGGVGKTRLALQCATELSTDSEQSIASHIYFVPLSTVRDEDLVINHIAYSIGVPQTENSESPVAKLSAHFGHHPVLLLLDNFEHIISLAPFITELLASCSQLKILITSRQALRISGEQEYPVLPLQVPTPEHNKSVEAILQYDSVQLFTQRAQAQQPDFQVTNDNVATVTQILIQLEGLPLSVELAAARLKLLGLNELATRLRNRCAVLRSGVRDAPDRHHTLRRAIAWSYDLLDPTEQTLFRCLSVFVGGFSLEAVRSIFAALPSQYVHIPEQEPIAQSNLDVQTSQKMDGCLEAVSSLLEKSLVLRNSPTEDELRFKQLETIREFGLEQLQDSGAENRVRTAHAMYYLQLAETIEPELMGPDQQAWLNRLELEHGNFHEALRWSMTDQASQVGPRLGVALWHFWYIRGHHKKGRAVLEELLLMTPDLKLRADLHYGLGMLTRREGDSNAALTNFEYSLVIYQELGDEKGEASSLRTLGFMEYLRGDYASARALLHRCLKKFCDLYDEEGKAAALTNLGYVAQAEHKLSEALYFQKESLQIRRASGNLHAISTTLTSMGYIAVRQGDLVKAREYLEECVQINETLRNDNGIGAALLGLGDAAFACERFDAADAHFRRALDIGVKINDKVLEAGALTKLATTSLKDNDLATAASQLKRALMLCSETLTARVVIAALEHVASILVRRNRNRQALKLAAAAESARIPLGKARLQANQISFDQTVGEATQGLETFDVNRAWLEGKSMSLRQASDLALQELG